MKLKNASLAFIGLLIVASIFLLVKEILNKIPNNRTEIKVVDSIENYNYTLDERDIELYQKEFKILKENLNGTVNEEEYAKSVAKMFVIDFYTLDNKITRYDVGGLEFLPTSNVENFKTKALDTIYKYITDNTDNLRKQELPIVNSTEISSIEPIKFEHNSNIYDAYEIKINWSYVKENNYDHDALLIVAKIDNKLYMVEEKRLNNNAENS